MATDFYSYLLEDKHIYRNSRLHNINRHNVKLEMITDF